jgi:hypothetical protein
MDASAVDRSAVVRISRCMEATTPERSGRVIRTAALCADPGPPLSGVEAAC